MNLTAVQLDALQELVNIGVGRGAGIVNEMVEAHISLEVPRIDLLEAEGLRHHLDDRINGDRVASVQMGFSGSFDGMAQLVFPKESAAALVAVLTGEELDTPDLDSVKIGTLTELGNIVLNGVMGSVSNVLKQSLDYSLPAYVEGTVENLLTGKQVGSKPAILLAHTRFTIEQLQVMGDIVLFFQVDSFDALLHAINRAMGEVS